MSGLVEWLRAIDHSSVEDCFLQSPLFGKAADEIERLTARVAELEEAGRDIMPYLRWTVSDESPGHHPTMPSAIAAFREALEPKQ